MSDSTPTMIFKSEGEEIKPIKVFPINGLMILAVYKGSLSRFDILLKYRQRIGNRWSRIRTPKHIHWAVDVLLKMRQNESLTREFLDFMIDAWNRTKPIDSENKRQSLSLDELLQISADEFG